MVVMLEQWRRRSHPSKSWDLPLLMKLCSISWFRKKWIEVNGMRSGKLAWIDVLASGA